MTGSRARSFVAALLLFSLGALPASALEVSVSSSRDAVSVGEQFTLSVEVRHDGMGSVPRPDLPPLENVRVVGDYQSSSFSFVNGKATSSVTIQYVMIADAEGEYTIGPVTVKKGDESVTSGTVTLLVQPAGSTATTPRRFGEEGASTTESGGKDLLVLGRVDNDAPYVNEQIVYTFTFLERVDLLQLDYQRPSWDGFWSEEVDTTEPTEVTFEGSRYNAQRVRTALFPMAPGDYEIGPATLRATVAERARRRRDPFDVFGNDRLGLFRSGRDVLLQTDPVVVTVRPLPEEGKPADFSGAVGQLQLTAKADRSEVKAGEAVTLRVTLSGQGNVKGVPAPDLSILKDFKLYESKSDESSQVRDGKVFGTKAWEYVLVPVTGGDVEIPPVRMSVFDPKQGRYLALATAAVPLQVEATDLDEALARGDDPSVAKERVRLRQRDIRFVKPAPRSLGNGGGSPFSSPVFLLAHAVPVLALAGSALFRRHRDRMRSDLRYARRRGAAKAASRRLKQSRAALDGNDLPGFFGELSAALRGYVGDKLHLSAANLEEPDVRDGLAKVGAPAEDVEELFALLDSADSARFSPIGSDPQGAREVFDRAERWLNRMERR